MPKWSATPGASGQTHRALVRDAGVIAVVAVHLVAAAAAACYAVDGAGTRPGLAVNIALAGWAVFRLAHRRVGTWWTVLDLGVIVAYLLITPVLETSSAFTTGASAELALAGTVIIAYGLAHPAIWSAATTAVVVVAWSIGIMRVPGAPAPWAVFSLDFLLVEWALVAFCRHLVVRAATLTDQLLDSAAAAEIARSVAVARHRQERRHCALMHDTAASTLLMVGTGSVTDRDVLTAQVDRDLATIAEFAAPERPAAAPVELTAHLRTLTATTVTPVHLRSSQPVLVDSPTATAVLGAAAEALTNIDRHANASHASVAVTTRSVTITDDGDGFDPGAQRITTRFGIRNSISARMEDVGGHALIESQPGTGTRVVLTWDVDPTQAPAIDPQTGIALSRQLLRWFGFGITTVSAVVILGQST